MFSKVLIANRGEIAIRIDQTLRNMGIVGVGVHTIGDRTSRHVHELTESVRLTDSERTGYLDIEQIISAALATGCEAVHPGYGFLAENPEFARRCAESGLTFIGPGESAIRAMGEKIAARACAERAGVPVVPGVSRPGLSDEEILQRCAPLEFPLLVKPSAGGGGKGLHLVHSMDELERALPVARREAANAFGDDSLFVERFIARARHIEFQVVADHHGRIVHLGERECSLQRRHQKVIEEAPSPLLDERRRSAMGASAVALAEAIGYTNIGTLEFLVDADDPDQYYFMEMNTRLQVEHRVTEFITSTDLVEVQVRIAAGESLDTVLPDVQFRGHAIEARIYAEDPYNDFLPTGGRVAVHSFVERDHVLVDSAVRNGTRVSGSFDPMLAKVVAWGPDRRTSTSELVDALRHSMFLGVRTNMDFLVSTLESPLFASGDVTTSTIESLSIESPQPPAEVLQSYAWVATRADDGQAWRSDGWRLRGHAAGMVHGYVAGRSFSTRPVEPDGECDWYVDEASIWIHDPRFGTWEIARRGPIAKRTATGDGSVVSPMPGVVVSVSVGVGDVVAAGQALMTVEAMKMEHVVRAKKAGKVTKCLVGIGDNVRAGQNLLEVDDD